MALICPTVLAGDQDSFKEQLKTVSDLARRIQIDLADGLFAPSRTVRVDQVTLPDGVKSDIHLMYRYPSMAVDKLIKMQPNLIILHAETDEDIATSITKINESDVKSGLALLEDSLPSDNAELIASVDHVLIFGGHLGYFGGEANLEMLSKVQAIRKINKQVEIGWDGGASDANVAELARGGIDVINVGSFIQKAPRPQDAYAILNEIITRDNGGR